MCNISRVFFCVFRFVSFGRRFLYDFNGFGVSNQNNNWRTDGIQMNSHMQYQPKCSNICTIQVIFFALFLLLLLLSSIFFWHFLFLVSSFYLSHPLFVPCSRWNDKEMFIEMERHIKTEKNTTKTLFAADMESVERNNNNNKFN